MRTALWGYRCCAVGHSFPTTDILLVAGSRALGNSNLSGIYLPDDKNQDISSKPRSSEVRISFCTLSALYSVHPSCLCSLVFPQIHLLFGTLFPPSPWSGHSSPSSLDQFCPSFSFLDALNASVLFKAGDLPMYSKTVSFPHNHLGNWPLYIGVKSLIVRKDAEVLLQRKGLRK